jgi:phage gpG-like protein
VIELKVLGAAELQAKFREAPRFVLQALGVGMVRATVALQSRVKQKLSDDVLRVRTGRLRRSINSKVEIESDGVTGRVGTNVVYAGVHEFGFDGVVNVREHLRTISYNGKGQIMAGRTKLGGTKKSVNSQSRVVVRAHDMRMKVPERSFLRSAFAEMRPQIAAEIENAAKDALKDMSA